MAGKLHQLVISSRPLFLLLLTLTIFFSVGIECSKYDQEELWLDDEVTMVQGRHSSLTTCDFTKGKWTYDQSYPLYDHSTCPYLSASLNCRENGRPDSDYEKWRWKPHGCTIPRFDALEFLGRMKRKRIMLVGDSITRNQWESLVCLVQSVVPTDRKTVIYNGPTVAFLALDYEASIEFCWAPLLVDLTRGAKRERIVRLDSIEEKAKYWRGVDVLVFDSAQWWIHSEKWSSWDAVMEGDRVYANINPSVAYERGLTTWAKWVDLNLDPRRTRVFFRSISPRHNNRENGSKCYGQRSPLGQNFSGPPEQLAVLHRILKRMEFPVVIQDITTMSALRVDGHPSIYARANSSGKKNDQRSKEGSSDCSHWCLPGVPDSWNEVLNAML